MTFFCCFPPQSPYEAGLMSLPSAMRGSHQEIHKSLPCLSTYYEIPQVNVRQGLLGLTWTLFTSFPWTPFFAILLMVGEQLSFACANCFADDAIGVSLGWDIPHFFGGRPSLSQSPPPRTHQLFSLFCPDTVDSATCLPISFVSVAGPWPRCFPFFLLGCKVSLRAIFFFPSTRIRAASRLIPWFARRARPLRHDGLFAPYFLSFLCLRYAPKGKSFAILQVIFGVIR